MNKRKFGFSLLFVLLIGGIIARATQREKESPEFSRVKKLQEKLLNDETLTQSERDAGWKEVKHTWSTLPKREQSILMAAHEQKERKQMQRFFELETQEERIAYLDSVIDQLDEKAAKQKKARQNEVDDEERKKKQSRKGSKLAANGKLHDPEAERAGLRNHLDATTADDRAKKRVYYTALKRRWAERHGVKK